MQIAASSRAARHNVARFHPVHPFRGLACRHRRKEQAAHAGKFKRFSHFQKWAHICFQGRRRTHLATSGREQLGQGFGERMFPEPRTHDAWDLCSQGQSRPHRPTLCQGRGHVGRPLKPTRTHDDKNSCYQELRRIHRATGGRDALEQGHGEAPPWKRTHDAWYLCWKGCTGWNRATLCRAALDEAAICTGNYANFEAPPGRQTHDA